LRAKVVKMAGIAKVDGKVVAEAQLMAAYGD
jgi:3-hydroxyacyl-[acyl-carrier-protein] dehydratase